MAIQIVCENEKEFDASVGAMVHCDATFSCPDEYLGKIVKCPGCQQPIRIGSSKRHISSATGKPAADPKRINQTAIARQTKRVSDAGRRSSVKSNGQASIKGQQKQTTAQQSRRSAKLPAENRTRNPSKTNPSANGKVSKNGTLKKNPKITKQVEKNVVKSGIAEKCPDCGTPIPDGSKVCPACHKIIQKPKGLGRSSFKISQSVGMHLWLKDHAFSGVPMKTVKLTINIFLGLLLVIAIAVGFITFNLRTAGLFLGIGTFLILPYLYMLYRCHIVCHDLGVPLAWWQRLFWNGILSFARSRGWPHESDATALHKRVILDLRSLPVDDNSIRSVNEISQAAVLDLTGSAITDDGCQVLHHLVHLQCLVLKGNKISPDEIARLQLSLPRCWIWT